MYVRATSTRLFGGRSTPAIRAIQTSRYGNSPPKLGGVARRAGVVSHANFARLRFGTTRTISTSFRSCCPPNSGGQFRTIEMQDPTTNLQLPLPLLVFGVD